MEQKLCNYCDTVKPLDFFAKKRGSPSTKCLGCAREYSRKHYLNNKKKYLERNRRRAASGLTGKSTKKICKCGGEMSANSTMCRKCYFASVRSASRERYDLWVSGDNGVLTKTMLSFGQLATGSLFRRFFFEDRDSACERCGWTHDFGDESLPPLEISHKDHDYSNMSYDNLELLCPNCHAVETRGNMVSAGNGRWKNNGFAYS